MWFAVSRNTRSEITVSLIWGKIDRRSHMRNVLVRIIAILAGLLLGFGVIFGVLLSRDNQNAERRVTIESNGSPSGESTITSTRSRPSDLDKIFLPPDRIKDLVIPFQIFDQKHGIATWIQAIDQNHIQDWLNQSIEAEWQVSAWFRAEFQKLLIQQYAKHRPRLALEFALARIEPVRSTLGSIVLFTWATNDLADATSRALELDPLDRYWAFRSIVMSQGDVPREQQQELARELGDESYALTHYFHSILDKEIENPQEVWFDVLPLTDPDNFRHLDVLDLVAKAWIKQAGLAVFHEIIASIEDHRAIETLSLWVLMDYADVQGQAEEAFDFALALHDDSLGRDSITLNTIISRWATQDAMAVLDRAESLPPSNVKQQMLRRGYEGRARREPEWILSNLNNVPIAYQESIGSTAVRALSQSSPSAAATLLLQIEDRGLKQKLAPALVYSWGAVDLPALKDWVLNLPGNETLRDSLIEPLTNLLVDTDPQLAFSLALQQPLPQNGEQLTGLEAKILLSIAQLDIDAAISLIPQVRDELKLSAISGVSRILIGSGDSERAIRLSNQLPEAEQLNYFENTIWEWLQTDSQGLVSQLDKLESTDTRSTLVLMMIGLNSETNAFNDEELRSLEQYLTDEHQVLLDQNRSEISR